MKLNIKKLQQGNTLEVMNYVDPKTGVFDIKKMLSGFKYDTSNDSGFKEHYSNQNVDPSHPVKTTKLLGNSAYPVSRIIKYLTPEKNDTTYQFEQGQSKIPLTMQGQKNPLVSIARGSKNDPEFDNTTKWFNENLKTAKPTLYREEGGNIPKFQNPSGAINFKNPEYAETSGDKNKNQTTIYLNRNGLGRGAPSITENILNKNGVADTTYNYYNGQTNGINAINKKHPAFNNVKKNFYGTLNNMFIEDKKRVTSPEVYDNFPLYNQDAGKGNTMPFANKLNSFYKINKFKADY